MFVRIRKEDVIDGVINASNIIPAKTGTTYLRILWLKAESTGLSIFATDSSLEFAGQYTANVQHEGLIGIQGKQFCELLRRMPPGELVLKTDEQGKQLHIEQGRRKYKVPTYDSSWFQDFHEFPDTGTITWSGEHFRDTIDRISFCIADEEEQASMNCIKFAPAETADVEVCGLNGHLLGLVRFTNAELHGLLGTEGFLVAKKYLQEIRRWITDGEIRLGLSDKRLFLRSAGGAEMLSVPLKLHTFPDYRSFIANHSGLFTSYLTIDKHEMTDALNRIFLFNTLGNSAAFFDVSPTELSMYAQGQDVGEGSELITCEFAGDLGKVAMPTKIILEVISHFTSDALKFSFINTTEPCCITGQEDTGYLVYTMPVEVVEDVYYAEVEM